MHLQNPGRAPVFLQIFIYLCFMFYAHAHAHT